MADLPSISIVIPTERARGTFERCLAALRASARPPLEIVCVADGMDEEARALAARFGCRVVANDGRGVSAARNTGARAARGEVVFFTDSDVLVAPDTLERVARRLAAGADGVVGVQSEELPLAGFFTAYKNLWMRHTYLRLPDRVALFYTSAAAIRRDLFLALEGFDENYRRPSVEDTDFGQVLGRAGARIELDRELAVVHLKGYDLAGVLRTDAARSAALVKHVLRCGSPRRAAGTSVPRGFQAACPLAGAGLLALAAGAPLLAAAGLAVFYGLNATWLAYLARVRGPAFALRAAAFLPLDALAVDAGIAAGLLGYLRGAKY